MNIPGLRSIIYDNGWYWSRDDLNTSLVDNISSYAVIDFLRELTVIDNHEASALLISNEFTHESAYFTFPDLILSNVPGKMGTSKYAGNSYYHTNSALFLQLGFWFDFLKKNNAYDNTRIIVVADHGVNIPGIISDEEFPYSGECKEKYNPVLLFKDFNQHGRLVINNEFMTNADVPSLALKGLLSDPVNPFTGKPISTESGKNGIFITSCPFPMVKDHGKYELNIKKDEWFFLKDSIFESKNWKKAEN